MFKAKSPRGPAKKPVVVRPSSEERRRQEEYFRRREAGFDLTGLHQSKLQEYNSLFDGNLLEYFGNKRLQQWLFRMNLIDAQGHVVNWEKNKAQFLTLQQEIKASDKQEFWRRRDEELEEKKRAAKEKLELEKALLAERAQQMREERLNAKNRSPPHGFGRRSISLSPRRYGNNGRPDESYLTMIQGGEEDDATFQRRASFGDDFSRKVIDEEIDEDGNAHDAFEGEVMKISNSSFLQKSHSNGQLTSSMKSSSFNSNASSSSRRPPSASNERDVGPAYFRARAEESPELSNFREEPPPPSSYRPSQNDQQRRNDNNLAARRPGVRAEFEGRADLPSPKAANGSVLSSSGSQAKLGKSVQIAASATLPLSSPPKTAATSSISPRRQPILPSLSLPSLSSSTPSKPSAPSISSRPGTNSARTTPRTPAAAPKSSASLSSSRTRSVSTPRTPATKPVPITPRTPAAPSSSFGSISKPMPPKTPLTAARTPRTPAAPASVTPRTPAAPAPASVTPRRNSLASSHGSKPAIASSVSVSASLSKTPRSVVASAIALSNSNGVSTGLKKGNNNTAPASASSSSSPAKRIPTAASSPAKKTPNKAPPPSILDDDIIDDVPESPSRVRRLSRSIDAAVSGSNNKDSSPREEERIARNDNGNGDRHPGHNNSNSTKGYHAPSHPNRDSLITLAASDLNNRYEADAIVDDDPEFEARAVEITSHRRKMVELEKQAEANSKREGELYGEDMDNDYDRG